MAYLELLPAHHGDGLKAEATFRCVLSRNDNKSLSLYFTSLYLLYFTYFTLLRFTLLYFILLFYFTSLHVSRTDVFIANSNGAMYSSVQQRVPQFVCIDGDRSRCRFCFLVFGCKHKEVRE